VSALPRLADCPPVAPITTDSDLQMISITVEGCQLSAPFTGDRFDTSAIDAAVWHVMRLRNFEPRDYRGWKTQQGSRNCIAVKVY